MFGFNQSKLEKSVRESVERIVQNALAQTDTTLAKLRQMVDYGAEVLKLREEIETLKIEKGRKEEESARKEREIEHKVGLERKRQEFEVEAAKRDATLTVREENLAADRKRFEDQMAFHEKRFSEEVTYLKEMVGQVLERLPNVTVAGSLGRKK